MFENKFGLTKDNAVKLVVDGYRGVSSNSKFTADERLEGSRELLKDLAKDYRRNKIDIFEIIEQSLDKILPEKLSETIGRFADVQNFKFGDAPKFTVRNGKITAYAVADGGGVNRHRLTKQSFTIPTEGIQAKVYAERARVLAGQVDFNELIDLAIEAVEEKLYDKVHMALIDTYKNLPEPNKATADKVDVNKLNKLIQVVKSYGNPIILGTGLGLAELPDLESDEARSDVYNQGYVGKWKGVPVVEIKNVVVDESNEEFKFEDRYLYIVPEGKDKIVKVAIEGGSEVREEPGKDWTTNFEINVKNGVAVLQNHHIAIYDNASLA